MRRTWNRQMPAEVRAILEPLLDKWDFVLPGWCDQLILEWDTVENDDESTLRCQPQEEYRQIRVIVFGQWLIEQEENREEAVLHELAHTLSAPLLDHAEDMLELGKGKTDGKLLDELERRALERTNCDVTTALMRAYERGGRDADARGRKRDGARGGARHDAAGGHDGAHAGAADG
jgi:hypothetical protein